MKRSIISAISVVLLSSLVTAQAQDGEGTNTGTTAAPGAPAAPVPPTPQSAAETPTTPPGTPAAAASSNPKTEVISVTGSRIKRKDLDVASPLTIMDRQAIEDTGAQTVTDIVKMLPSAVGNSVTTTTTNGGGGGSGNIALRGLDSSSTLILLNGRRLPTDANGYSPDLNSIPMAAIERIEVLQDGASAIYGSDAIAGVVNIITRTNVDGVDLGLYFGRASRGDLETKNLDLVYGTGNDKGNLLFGLNYYTQGNVASRDRQVSRQAFNPSSATPNGHVIGPMGNLIVDPAFTGPNPTPANYVPFTRAAAYNYSSITDAIMAQDRKSVFLSGDYEINSNVKAFVETMFTNTYSTYNSAPTPLFTNQETGGITVSPLNPYNPFGVELTDVRKRFLEMGPRGQIGDSNTLRLVAGLQGEVKKWTWDIAANHAESNVRTTNKNIINKTNLLLGLGDPANCTAVASLGCVPVNVTGPYGSVDEAQINWLRIDTNEITKSELNSYTFNTAGDLAETGLGTIGMAAGVEIRDEEYVNDADANSAAYNTIGDTNRQSTKGDRTVKEAYVEFSIPFTKVVELELAARYSDYSDFGDTTNPKVGLKINPVGGLTLRGTYARGFRAPSLIELYQGQAENFAQLVDPCQTPGNCQVQSDPDVNQWLALQGGNPELEPEKSKSYTFGLAYTYNNIFNAKADYFVIDTENAIDTNPQFVVDQFRANGSFADRITLDAANNITQIRAGALNLAARRVKGLDLGVDYSLRETAAGSYTFSVLATHYVNYQNQPDASSPFVNVVGKYVDTSNGGRGSIPKWKGVAGIDWSQNAVDAGVQMNYVSKLDAGADYNRPTLDAWRTYDLHVGYDLAAAGKFTLGVDNVTDKAPPSTDAAFNDNIDARTHNLIGRFFYARYGIQI